MLGACVLGTVGNTIARMDYTLLVPVSSVRYAGLVRIFDRSYSIFKIRFYLRMRFLVI